MHFVDKNVRQDVRLNVRLNQGVMGVFGASTGISLKKYLAHGFQFLSGGQKGLQFEKLYPSA